MKTLKYISIFILLIGFAFAMVQCTKDSLNVKTENDSKLELRSFSDDCLPPQGPTCIQIEDTINLSVSQFPGCVFNVHVTVQKCPTGNNEWTYNIGDFEVLSHNCPAFDSIVQNSGQQYLEYFTYQFGKWVRNALTNYYLINDIQLNGGTRATINHYFASCVKTCYFEVWDRHDPKNIHLEYMGIERLNCGENCCQFETIHELINGVWVLLSENTTGPTEPCSQSATAICGRGTVSSTPCTAQCGGPDM